MVVRNAANGKYASTDLGSMDSAGAVCFAILNTAIQAGLQAALEGSAVAVYGAGNSVSVSFAAISMQNF